MASGNTVTLQGNATRDPELRFLDNGTPVAQFSIAVPRRFRKGDEWVEEPHFFDVTVWNSLAENVAETVRKGTRVIVDGRIDFRQWETDEGKRSKVEVTAEDVGVSLRWATAEITKNEKSDKKGSSSSSAGDPGPVPPPDEEPF